MGWEGLWGGTEAQGLHGDVWGWKMGPVGEYMGSMGESMGIQRGAVGSVGSVGPMEAHRRLWGVWGAQGSLWGALWGFTWGGGGGEGTPTAHPPPATPQPLLTLHTSLWLPHSPTDPIGSHKPPQLLEPL